MRKIANGLTTFRVVCAVLVPVLIFTGMWAAAAFFFVLGCLSDAGDGEIVRRAGLPDDPKGAQRDQTADMAFTALPLMALVVAEKIPMWVVICMGLGTVVLVKYVYAIPRESKMFVVRRHAHYLHPLLYVALLGYMLIVLTLEATDRPMPWLVSYGVLAMAVGYVKRDRIKMFLAGPKG